MTDKILFIDDEKNILTAIKRQLRKDFDLVVALGGEEGVRIAKEKGPFAVAVSDMRMPGKDGVTTLKEIEQASPNTVRIMLTGNADQETAVEAINQGRIFRFLNKPCPEDVLRKALKDALRQHQMLTAEKTLLQHTLAGSVKVLMDVLSLSDPSSYGQAKRVRLWAKKIAERLELKNPWDLEMAATLAPIGLVAVPPEILTKKRNGEAISPEEQEIIDSVPGTGRRLISNIPRLEGVADMVFYKEKAYSGEGYPFDEEIAGNQIPYGARILKLLSDLSLITTTDVPTAQQIQKLNQQSELYDPKVLQAAVELWGNSDEENPGAVGDLKEVALDMVIAGDMLVADVKLENGNLLLSAGNEITGAQLERMRALRKVTKIVEPLTIRRST